MSIAFGVDRLVADPGLLGNVRRVGLLTNDAARLAGDSQRQSRTALLDAGVPVVRLFAPEHGLSARAPDGVAVNDGVDQLTGLHVVSLYGATMIPPAAALEDLDCVLFDVPDVGVRFYTYNWTLSYAIDACAAAHIALIVLDRPNPLGGMLEYVEGPIVEARNFSFIGRHSIPIRHSLTLGEIGQLWRAERCKSADVRVIPCNGWKRAQLWRDTGLPFVATSPAISSFETVLFYPGMCLFEATNLSIARGTPSSFQAVGAPWLDSNALLARFAARGLPAVQVEGTQFTPTIGPHKGTLCHGVQLRTNEPAAVRPVLTALALLADVIATHPREFAWGRYRTVANPEGEGHFERLFGRSGVRAELERAPAQFTTEVLQSMTETPGWAERWRNAQYHESRTEAPIAR
jgi:uncharacterized protein YbbC (DUF1343 family)